MARRNVLNAAKGNRKIARIKPLGEARMKRSKINNGISLINAFSMTQRTFTIGDVPAMMEDDQVALGMDYLKIPIAQAPIAVKVSKPEAYGWTCDLYERVWNALIPKMDIAFGYGDACYEALYRKDRDNPALWDFFDFDIAPPLSSVPWTNNENLAFVAVHGDGVMATYSSYWFDTASLDGADILEGAGVLRPAKCLWIANDCLLSRWFGRSVMRASHMRWKCKNMPDGGMENLAKAMYKSAFSGILIRYPAGDSVVDESGNIVTSETYADFLLQTAKTGSGIRLPAHLEGMPGWDIEQYSKNLIDLKQLIDPLDYLDRGILRGMGIPDEILTHDSSTGGYARSLVSVDAFFSRGETRAETILPNVTEMIVAPLVRQRYGIDCKVSARILRQMRPGDNQQQQDANGNNIPDSLEGSMGGQQQPGQPMQGQQPPPQYGNIQPDQSGWSQPPSRFSIAMSAIKKKEDRAANAALSGAIASGIAVLAGDTGRVLMLQRANNDDDKAAGTWEFPGGHIESGETPLESAIREWSEETGQPFPAGKKAGQWESSNGKYVGFLWKIKSEDQVDIHADNEVFNPDDPDGDNIEVVAWFDAEHLKDNPAIRPELQKDIDIVLDEMDDASHLAMAVTHAPKGGASVKGKKYAGGEFLPSDEDIKRTFPDTYEGANEAEKAVKEKYGNIFLNGSAREAKSTRELTDDEYKELSATVKLIAPGSSVRRKNGRIDVHIKATHDFPWKENLVREYFRKRGWTLTTTHAHPLRYGNGGRLLNVRADVDGPHPDYSEATLAKNAEREKFEERFIAWKKLVKKQRDDGWTPEDENNQYWKGTADEQKAKADEVKALAKERVDYLIGYANKMNDVSDEQRKTYIKTMQDTIDRMSAPMVHHFMMNTIGIDTYKHCGQLTSMVNRSGGNIGSGIVGGMWAWHSGLDGGILHLDGGYTEGAVRLDDALKGYPQDHPKIIERNDNDRHEIYRHEAGHSFDAHPIHGMFYYTAQKEWEDAYNSEIAGGQISDYGASSQHEGWAEYVRLLLSDPPAAKSFKKSYDFFLKKGLVNGDS